jgi:hypothetical protein
LRNNQIKEKNIPNKETLCKKMILLAQKGDKEKLLEALDM